MDILAARAKGVYFSLTQAVRAKAGKRLMTGSVLARVWNRVASDTISRC